MGSGEGCREGPGEGFGKSLVQGQVKVKFDKFNGVSSAWLCSNLSKDL